LTEEKTIMMPKTRMNRRERRIFVAIDLEAATTLNEKQDWLTDCGPEVWLVN
jgi:hypothetical protein